ncbi:HsdM family class I SAM-dependent methyltransferase [Maritalea sp.]|uniref:HsdM family class I SAM-dependent methyltransferase n=1 Tax=Maritalea sp. TaxID=2003361 RepID=UPI003EF6347E
MNFMEFETEQKLRGGYYTPDDLARFLARWVSPNAGSRILEPSCGDGAFLSAIATQHRSATVTAFELSPEEAQKANSRALQSGLTDCTVHQEDFLGWALEAKGAQFDAILGNPPFIRYQYLPAKFQQNAEQIFNRLDCKFTKHTNAWVPFVLASLDLLRPGGRLAMVVPSEIVHVMHAQSLRTYLGEQCRRIVIVDPQEIWFEGTLQGAVLLMAEKKKTPTSHGEGLGIQRVAGRAFLNKDPEVMFNTPQAINGRTVQGKWTRALVPPATLEILDKVEASNDFCRFNEAAKVDVGIVTGANKFFLVTDDVVQRYGLQKWAHPMFGRSDHCPGVIYDGEQHTRNAASGKPTNFLWLDSSVEDSVEGREYIQSGENENFHKRYKCRIRKPWYTVPSVHATEVGMLKRSHDTPRLIHNRIGAYTTDTAYRIRALRGTAQSLVYGFFNSLTALSAELEGRHYGGGVLELVPSEIEKLLLPKPEGIVPDIERLDRMVRGGTVADTLEVQSEHVLNALSKAEQMDLLASWSSLRDRRHRLPA